MLEAELRPERTHYASVEAQLEEIGDEIWDRAQMHAALRAWAGALNADSQWSESLGAQSGTANNPTMSFAPALILRKRTQTGMVRIYEDLIAQLSADAVEVPSLWGGLIDDVGDHAGAPQSRPEEARNGHSLKANSEIYFPLPANREQRRIVEVIDQQRGVLVQGPPGTGKSHTIANLMCHLLATGKRVLITAETGRALQVLKNKLPKEIQPLCVNLLGQGGDAFAELNTAVQGITTRQAAYSPGADEERTKEIDQDLDKARRRLAQFETEIRSLREEETCPQSIADGVYHGTASSIAKRVASEREHHVWLRLPDDAPSVPPLPTEDIVSWLGILRRYTNDEIRQASAQIPPSSNLPAPAEFASAVGAEATASATAAASEALTAHHAFDAVQTLSRDMREQLRSQLQRLEEQRLALRRMDAAWSQAAIEDLIAGRRARWDAVLERSRDRLASIAPLLDRVGNLAVTIPDTRDPRRVRADVETALRHLTSGGKWKRFGLVVPKPIKGCVYVKGRGLGRWPSRL